MGGWVIAKVRAVNYLIHTRALRAELCSKGATIAPTAILGRFYFVGDPEKLTIGHGAVINDRVMLNAAAELFIGDYASISPLAQIHTGYLHPDGVPRKHGYGSVRIGENAWIASGAIVSAGVTVGTNAIVGAGAVVTRDVEPDVFVAGVPARLVRRLD